MADCFATVNALELCKVKPKNKEEKNINKQTHDKQIFEFLNYLSEIANGQRQFPNFFPRKIVNTFTFMEFIHGPQCVVHTHTVIDTVLCGGERINPIIFSFDKLY